MYDLSVFELDEGIEHYDFWLLNGYTGVLTPMSLASYVDQHRHGCQYGAEMLPFPRNAAVDFRAKDGMTWLCVNRVEPEDIPEREDRYRQRILGFIEDYDTVWGEVVAEMMGRYEQLRSADVDTLGNFELVLHFEDAWQVRGRMWDLHYLMMNGIFGLYVLFEQQCRGAPRHRRSRSDLPHTPDWLRQQEVPGRPRSVATRAAGVPAGPRRSHARKRPR